jgi:hypothetical protein
MGDLPLAACSACLQINKSDEIAARTAQRLEDAKRKAQGAILSNIVSFDKEQHGGYRRYKNLR